MPANSLNYTQRLNASPGGFGGGGATINDRLFISGALLDGRVAPIVAHRFNIFHNAGLIPLH